MSGVFSLPVILDNQCSSVNVPAENITPGGMQAIDHKAQTRSPFLKYIVTFVRYGLLHNIRGTSRLEGLITSHPHKHNCQFLKTTTQLRVLLLSWHLSFLRSELTCYATNGVSFHSLRIIGWLKSRLPAESNLQTTEPSPYISRR